ncbi:GntR family transcriptional regulator [Chitinasiproducens palmae]|nr:GntR family transcriptional regulator [Chitinasiproducens palmae]
MEELDSGRPRKRQASRAETVYTRLREAIFEFRLMPGDRFTENEVAARLGTSRTPVREALLRLQADGLVQVHFRNGWEVVPLDFTRFAELYELRLLIERQVVTALCVPGAPRVDRTVLTRLGGIWRVEPALRAADGAQVAALDEAFHIALARAAGNRESAAVLEQVTDRIRLIRRIDFDFPERIALTYDEHIRLLDALQDCDCEAALTLLDEHIDDSHATASRITVERLQQARAARPGAPLGRPGRLWEAPHAGAASIAATVTTLAAP